MVTSISAGSESNYSPTIIIDCGNYQVTHKLLELFLTACVRYSGHSSSTPLILR